MRGPIRVPIQGKCFDLLLAFVQNADRLITKDELAMKCWQDGIATDGNLAQHISTLRKLLGEQSDDHRYIVTICKAGYRFVATTTARPQSGSVPAPA